MEESKFKIGDRVSIIKYGHPAYLNKVFYDAAPGLIGQVGTIEQVKELQGKTQYAITGISAKYAWYEDDQLEKFEITIN